MKRKHPKQNHQQFAGVQDLTSAFLTQGASGTYNVLGFTIHHIICDGWSMRELTHDLASAYHDLTTGQASHWGKIDVQYTDFAAWQQDQMTKVRLCPRVL